MDETASASFILPRWHEDTTHRRAWGRTTRSSVCSKLSRLASSFRARPWLTTSSIGTRQDTCVSHVGMFWTAPSASLTPRPFLPTAAHLATHAPMQPCWPRLHLTGLQRCLQEPLSRGRAGFSLSPAAGTLARACTGPRRHRPRPARRCNVLISKRSRGFRCEPSDRELVVSIFSIITLFSIFRALIRARSLPRYSFPRLTLTRNLPRWTFPLPLIAVHHEEVTNVKRPLVYHCPPACGHGGGVGELSRLGPIF